MESYFHRKSSEIFGAPPNMRVWISSTVCRCAEETILKRSSILWFHFCESSCQSSLLTKGRWIQIWIYKSSFLISKIRARLRASENSWLSRRPKETWAKSWSDFTCHLASGSTFRSWNRLTSMIDLITISSLGSLRKPKRHYLTNRKPNLLCL